MIENQVGFQVKNFTPNSKQIKRNVPRSSRIHCLVLAYSHERKRLLNCQVIYSPLFRYVRNKTRYSQRIQQRQERQQIYRSYRTESKIQQRISRSDLSTCTFKNLNHVKNCCIFQLVSDIEKNPGPTCIDPSKTVRAPYSQGNVDVFGSYAGRQCVAMSLCALIYNSNKQITESQDLIEIMNIGNELYGALSRLTSQTYLLPNELPTMVTISNTNYQLEFSDCYSSYLHSSALNENIPNVMPLDDALHNLIQDCYN